MKSAFYLKSSLPLANTSEWVGKYLTVYCEQIRNKTSFGNALKFGQKNKSNETNPACFTEPVIDITLFQRIRFTDGMPRILIDLFSLLIGDQQAIIKAFKLLRPDTFKGRTASKRQTKSQMGFAPKLFAHMLEKRIMQVIPPLKEFPSEEVSSESCNSDRTDKVLAKGKLELAIRAFKD